MSRVPAVAASGGGVSADPPRSPLGGDPVLLRKIRDGLAALRAEFGEDIVGGAMREAEERLRDRKITAAAADLASRTGQDPKEVESGLRIALREQGQRRIEELRAKIEARKNAPGTRRFKRHAPRTPPLKTVSKAYMVVAHDEQGREGVYAADRIAGKEFTTPTASYVVGDRGEVRRVGRVKQTKKQRVAARRAAKTGG